MGFKDLALFNDALLANQACRMLHNKKSLLFWIFKEKFFPNCSVMEAKAFNSGSYAWNSILKGRDILKKGSLCRVGNGESIKLWADNWLPIPRNFGSLNHY